MTTRRTYDVNPEPPAGPEADPQPKGPTGAQKAGTFLKTMAMVAVTALVSVIAVDIYRKYKKPPEPELPEGMLGNPMMGGMMGTSVLPLPIPWPMGGYGMGAPPAANPPQKSASDELELARLNTERAKAEALKAQMDAFLIEDDC